MDYWGELFLNEGFASYMEDVGAQAVQPGFKYMDRFYVSDVIAGLSADSKNSTHPLASFDGALGHMHLQYVCQGHCSAHWKQFPRTDICVAPKGGGGF